MSEQPPRHEPSDEPAEAEVVEKRRFSIVWIIPLVALVIAGGIYYRQQADRGPVVTLLLSNGSGLEAGKTKVKFRGLDAGDVVEVGIRDIDTVEATLQMGPGAWPFMTDATQFWVVRPRVGAGGITGLDTLVAGSYIQVEPGVDDFGNPVGNPTLEFRALDDPPLSATYKNPLNIVLLTTDLRGATPGAPVSFRDIRVGEIERYELSPSGHEVKIYALIDRKYKHLVRPSTEFWNASGIRVDVKASGISFEAESVAALLSGGIEFETPPDAQDETPVDDGAVFNLHANRAVAEDALDEGIGLEVIVEARSVGSLSAGDTVFYREVNVGMVEEPMLSDDSKTVRFSLHIDEKYAPLIRRNTKFWNRTGVRFKADLDGVDVWAGSVGTILRPGVAFATPTWPGPRVEADHLFVLHEAPQQEWLDWDPKITLDDADPNKRIKHALRPKATGHAGFHLVLESVGAGSLDPGDPIYYRELRVGQIGDKRFTDDARRVRVDAYIDRNYQHLVRTNTRFWNASGIDVEAGLTGFKVRTESVRAIVTGGVAFATPDQPGAMPNSGATFELYEEPEDEWLDWSPSLKPGSG